MPERFEDPGAEYIRIAGEDRFMRFLRKHDPLIDTSYAEQENVGGTEIIVEWDEEYADYVLYLPGIDLSYAHAEGFAVPDQLIRIGSDKNLAKEVFDETKAVAKESADVYGLIETMDQRIRERTSE